MSKPILIAELCQNHNGSRETLKRMIHEATAAGADYAKIQGLHSWDLTFRDRFEEGVTAADGAVQVIKRPFAAEKARLEKLDLTPDDEAWFVDECRRAGVRSMTTVFTRASVAALADMGFDAIKIASYDCRAYPLLRDVKKYWSTIVVSTGATYDTEIERTAVELVGRAFSFLHCVTIYPTPINELHLRRMSWLRRFTSSVGFSDHSKPSVDGLWPTKIALAVGADLIERHFTVLAPDATRDGPVSITTEMLAELRAFADKPRPEQMAEIKRGHPEWERALGQAHRPLSHQEQLNRDYYAGRVASKVDGRDVFNWEDVEL